MPSDPQVWHVWKRPRGSNDSWQQVAGIKGTRMQVLDLMGQLERQGSDVDWEFMAMPDDERPAEQTYRTRMMRPGH